MIEFIYLVHCQDRNGQPMTRRTSIVTHIPTIATRLLAMWSTQGLRTGHRYEPVGFFIYPDDINGLQWVSTPVGDYAPLRTELTPSAVAAA